MNIAPLNCNVIANNIYEQKRNTNFKASYSGITETLSNDTYNFGENTINKLLKTIKTSLPKKEVKILHDISSENLKFTQWSMNRIFKDNFQTRKEILIKELSGLIPQNVIEKIKSVSNSSELAAIVERFQTGMIVDAEDKVMRIKTINDFLDDDLHKEILKELVERCKKNDAIQTAIQRALIVKTSIPKIKQMEETLLKEYGLKASLGNSINNAKRIYEACKIWYESGEKLPEEIIVSKCMPIHGVAGQRFNKTVILSKDFYTLFKITAIIDKLSVLLNRIPHFSTNSQYHIIIHEFSHTVQPQAIRNENIELPQHLQKAAKNVSKYASESEGLSELYAELKTKSFLAKEKMKKEEIELLIFLESLK